jgi:hypothetical protein
MFSGTVQSGNRTLKVESVDIRDLDPSTVDDSYTFKIEMIITGPALPGGKTMRFRVAFSPIRYTFQDGLVTQFMPDRTPKVDCSNP